MVSLWMPLKAVWFIPHMLSPIMHYSPSKTPFVFSSCCNSYREVPPWKEKNKPISKSIPKSISTNLVWSISIPTPLCRSSHHEYEESNGSKIRLWWFNIAKRGFLHRYGQAGPLTILAYTTIMSTLFFVAQCNRVMSSIDNPNLNLNWSSLA